MGINPIRLILMPSRRFITRQANYRARSKSQKYLTRKPKANAGLFSPRVVHFAIAAKRKNSHAWWREGEGGRRTGEQALLIVSTVVGDRKRGNAAREREGEARNEPLGTESRGNASLYRVFVTTVARQRA